jgi:hypothetical protein
MLSFVIWCYLAPVGQSWRGELSRGGPDSHDLFQFHLQRTSLHFLFPDRLPPTYVSLVLSDKPLTYSTYLPAGTAGSAVSLQHNARFVELSFRVVTTGLETALSSHEHRHLYTPARLVSWQLVSKKRPRSIPRHLRRRAHLQ